MIRGLLGFALGLGVGCGSEDRVLESTSGYEAPGEHRVVIEAIVEAPFEVVWDRLSEVLAASDLRILNSDQASQFLVVDLDRSTDAALSSHRPDRFVDCGHVRQSFLEDGHAMEFVHGIAESSRHIEVVPGTDAFEVRDVSRVVDLSARATIYLKPDGPKRTRVTVNSRYGLSVVTSGTTRQVPRDAAAKEGEPHPLAPVQEAIRFTTFTRSPLAAGPVCVATGEFERTLLELTSVPDAAPPLLEAREEAAPRDQARE